MTAHEIVNAILIGYVCGTLSVIVFYVMFRNKP